MESEGEHFLAYYLLKDEDEIPSLEEQRTLAIESDNPEPSAVSRFHQILSPSHMPLSILCSNLFAIMKR